MAYKIETRLKEDSETWKEVIDLKRSKTAFYPRIFMNEEEVQGFVKHSKLKDGLYRVIEIDQ